MRTPITILLSVLLICPSCFAQTTAPARGDPPGLAPVHYQPVLDFDETRNATADIQAALSEAARTHKRVILYIGGAWCPYCQQLEALFRQNPDLLQLRESHYIILPIAYGKDGNPALSRYGRVLGIPHFFVLESNGYVLQSQHVMELRENGNYSAAKMKDFLNQHSPQIADASSQPTHP